MRLLGCFRYYRNSRRNRKRNRVYRRNLPNECLLDVLQALNRDSLDSCELACRRHHELIEAKSEILPLRHMTQLNLVGRSTLFEYKLFITPCVVVFYYTTGRARKLELCGTVDVRCHHLFWCFKNAYVASLEAKVDMAHVDPKIWEFIGNVNCSIHEAGLYTSTASAVKWAQFFATLSTCSTPIVDVLTIRAKEIQEHLKRTVDIKWDAMGPIIRAFAFDAEKKLTNTLRLRYCDAMNDFMDGFAEMFQSMSDSSTLPSTITIPWFPYHRYTDSLEIVDTFSVQSKASLSGSYEVTVYEPILNPVTGHVLRVFSSLDALPARKGPFGYPTFECPTPAENETNLLFVPEYKNYESSKFRYAF